MSKTTATAITRPATPEFSLVSTTLEDMGFGQSEATRLGEQVCKGHACQAKGFEAMLEFGGVLHEIKTEGLYSKVYGEGGFAQFCKEMFGFSNEQGRRILNAHLVYANIPPMGGMFTSERQLRPFTKILAKHRTDNYTDLSERALKKVRKELKEVCKLIEERLEHDYKMTASLVADCMKEYETRELAKADKAMRKEMGVEEPKPLKPEDEIKPYSEPFPTHIPKNNRTIEEIRAE